VVAVFLFRLIGELAGVGYFAGAKAHIGVVGSAGGATADSSGWCERGEAIQFAYEIGGVRVVWNELEEGI